MSDWWLKLSVITSVIKQSIFEKDNRTEERKNIPAFCTKYICISHFVIYGVYSEIGDRRQEETNVIADEVNGLFL